MAITVNVLCYKSKTLGNGEHPLMICVCMDGKRKYKSLGVSVRAEHWNFEKNIPKSNCPNKEYINILIANKKKEYETEIVKLKSEDKLFTANTLNEQVSNSVKPKTVKEVLPYTQIGGRILYRASDIERTLMDGYKEAYRQNRKT